jgi:hypothetical protein
MASQQQIEQIEACKKDFGLLGKVIGIMEISELKKALTPNEVVEALVYGTNNSSFVFMAATNERVYYIDKRLMNSRIDGYSYSHIESINYDIGVFAGMVSLVAANGAIELRFAPNKLIRRFVSITQQRIHKAHSMRRKSIQPSRPVQSQQEPQFQQQLQSPVDYANELDLLERLAKLHNDGALSDDQYETQKKKIIG